MRVPGIIGPYAVDQVLGRGSQGQVWRGRCRVTEAQVAVKVSHGVLTERSLERVRREFLLSRRIEDPAVPRARRIGTLTDGRTYVVSDFVDGTHLWRWRQSLGPVGSASRMCRVGYRLSQLARILSRVHDRGVIHGDLKLSAAMVDHASPALRLLDFGGAVEASVPASGRYFGTARYSSPEQLRRAQLTPGSDIWSFGAVGTLLLTGEWPLKGTRRQVEQQLRATPGLAQRALDAFDGPLVELLRRCLRWHATERPAATWVAERLGEIFTAPRWAHGGEADPVALGRARSVLADARPGALLAVTGDDHERLGDVLGVLQRDAAEIDADITVHAAAQLDTRRWRQLAGELDEASAEGRARLVVLHGTTAELARHVIKSRRLVHVPVSDPQPSSGSASGTGYVTPAVTAARARLDEVTSAAVEKEVRASQRHLASGDLERCQVHARRAFQLKPWSPVAIAQLTRVLLRAGRWSELRDALAVAAESREGPRGVILEAWAKLEAARHARAELEPGAREEALVARGDWPGVMQLRLRQGDHAGAWSAAQRFTGHLDSHDAEAFALLPWVTALG